MCHEKRLQGKQSQERLTCKLTLTTRSVSTLEGLQRWDCGRHRYRNAMNVVAQLSTTYVNSQASMQSF